MAAEMEFVPYKDFVEGLTEASDFAATDKRVVSNSTNGPRSMLQNTADKIEAQRTLAGNVSPAFVPNVTAAKRGKLYMYKGSLYEAKEDYTGEWDASKFTSKDIDTIFSDFSVQEDIYRNTIEFLLYGVDKLVQREGIITIGGDHGGSAPDYTHAVLLIKSGCSVKLTAGPNGSKYSFLKSYGGGLSSFEFATGYTESVIVAANESVNLTAPNDARYLYLTMMEVLSRVPESIVIDGEYSLDFAQAKRTFCDVPYETVSGKYINGSGSESSLVGTTATNYVAVRPGYVLEVDHVMLTGSANIAFYSDSKAFVAVFDKTGVVNPAAAHVMITIPANCYYIRWSYDSTYVSRAQIGSNLYEYTQSITKPYDSKFQKLQSVSFEIVENKYINQSGGETALNGYNCTGFVPVVPGTHFEVFHAFLGSASSFAFYDSGKRFMSILDESGIYLYDAHIDITIPNGCYYVRWAYNAVNFTTSAMIYDVSLTDFVFGLFSSFRSTPSPVATLVDDDSHPDYVSNVKSVCDATGVKCSFAVIYTRLESNPSLLALLHSYQEEGFNIIDHPQTTGWGETDDTWNLTDAERVLVKSLIYLKSNNFLDCEHFVAPGGYINPTMLEMVSKWCKSGIGKNNGSPNHLAQDGKYNLHRLFIGEGDSDTLADYTATIDRAYANNDWLIFGTHSYRINTAAKIQLLTDVINYAKTKGFVFKTYNKAFDDRKHVFDLTRLYQ